MRKHVKIHTIGTISEARVEMLVDTQPQRLNEKDPEMGYGTVRSAQRCVEADRNDQPQEMLSLFGNTTCLAYNFLASQRMNRVLRAA